jgi:hypothetical protein
VESGDLVSNPFAPAHYLTDKHDLPPRKGELPALAEWIDGCIAEDGADWRSPYHIPRELAELFMRFKPLWQHFAEGYFRDEMRANQEAFIEDKVARLSEKVVFEWDPKVTATADQLNHIAEIIESLAHQTESIAKQLRRSKGRRPTLAERGFRDSFARYAKARAGKYLDGIGAVLFSLTFYPMNRPEYARLRQREAKPQRRRVRRRPTTKNRQSR